MKSPKGEGEEVLLGEAFPKELQDEEEDNDGAKDAAPPQERRRNIWSRPEEKVRMYRLTPEDW